MIPIRDTNPTKRTPFITYLLITTNVLVFVYMYTLGRSQLVVFLRDHAFIPADFSTLDLFTSLFLHGGVLHLVVNMIFLYIFGDNIEDYLGHFKFLLFYLLVGALASLAHFAIKSQSTVPTLGASGAIAGTMGAYLLLYPNSQIDVVVPLFLFFPVLRVPAFTMIVYWVIYQLLQGFSSVLTQVGAGIAYFAHIGGFFSGLLLIKALKNFK